MIFLSINSDFKFTINDNSSVKLTLYNSHIDYNDNNIETLDAARERLLDDLYVDGDQHDGSANSFLFGNSSTSDLSHNYFAYEENIRNGENTQLIKSIRNDKINLPKWAYIEENTDWTVYFKKFNQLPDSNSYIFDLSQPGNGIFDIRWNYTIRKYTYDKTTPADPTKVNIIDISSSSGISKNTNFDFTQYNINYYPTDLLDISFTKLIDSNNQQYFNLNLKMKESTIRKLRENARYNYGDNAIPIVKIYGKIPKKYFDVTLLSTNNSLQNELYYNNQNNFSNIKGYGIENDDQFSYNNNPLDTSTIDYSLFDISFSYYNAENINIDLRNYNIPYEITDYTNYNSNINTNNEYFNNLSDISGIISNKGLRAGKYIFEWTYDVSNNGSIIPNLTTILDKYNTYIPSQSVRDISLNMFIKSDLNSNILIDPTLSRILVNSNIGNLLLHNNKELVLGSLTTFNPYNVYYKFNTLLYTPLTEISTSNTTTSWSLPLDFTGINDNRLNQIPVINNSQIYSNENNYGEPGYNYNLATFNDNFSNSNFAFLTSIKNQLLDISSHIYNSDANFRDLMKNMDWSNNSLMTNGYKQLPFTLISNVGNNIVTDLDKRFIPTDNDGNVLNQIQFPLSQILDPSNTIYNKSTNSYYYELYLHPDIKINNEGEGNILVGTTNNYIARAATQTFIGVYLDGNTQNDGWIYRKDGVSYSYPLFNNIGYTIRWICIQINDTRYDMHIVVNNKLIYKIENGGISEKRFKFLGHNKDVIKPRDGSWNYGFDTTYFQNYQSIKKETIGSLKYTTNKLNLSTIELYGLYDTEIYKIIDNSEAGGSYPLSSDVLSNRHPIPYISRLDYNIIYDSSLNINLKNLISNMDIIDRRKSNFELNNSGNDFSFKNYTKYLYGHKFVYKQDTEILRTPYSPKAPEISYNVNTNLLEFSITNDEYNFLKYSLEDDWQVKVFLTRVQFKIFAFFEDLYNIDGSSNLMIATNLT